jgi:hypothetical protein
MQYNETLPCHAQFDSVDLGGLSAFDRRRLDRSLSAARLLFRLHRASEALQKLDWSISELTGRWGRRIPDRERADIVDRFKAFRQCLAASRAPGLAMVTIRTFEYDASAAREHGQPLGGAYIYMDNGVRLGRTDANGTWKGQVPSGPSELSAVAPPSSAGEEIVQFAPGATGSVSIVLDDSKEPADETDANVVEAVDDAVRPTSRSFTVQFIDDGVKVPTVAIDDIEVEDPEGNAIGLHDREGREIGTLADLFTVENGDIVAKTPAGLLASLPLGQWTVLAVTAVDTASLRHWDRIRFRIQETPGCEHRVRYRAG